MKKIPGLFVRERKTGRMTGLSRTECHWVRDGEGWATIKIDGTACMVEGGALFKRLDRKLPKDIRRAVKHTTYVPVKADYKDAPADWVPCQEPDMYTWHWPGWTRVTDSPDDQWHREAFAQVPHEIWQDGTYELVGPKVQGNPYYLVSHELWGHGTPWTGAYGVDPPRNYDALQAFLATYNEEGIVWYHPDGRMAKIKRRDFGLAWPLPLEMMGDR